ncbi:MAG TPA: alpha/beta fold hydrolase [Kofleriaceae bacterium]|nr:alpha/beta fold hydrolase [Kofleriaceae bacterium]
MVGHMWTLGTHLRDRILVPPAPPSLPWRGSVEDAKLGRVSLSGYLSLVPGAKTLVVIVHGLGGSAESGYCRRAARVCTALGASALRLNLRGADLSGADLYHAGLTADVHAALTSAVAASVDRVVVLGFSLGGHIALKLAIEAPPRLAAVAAVCAPLCLARSCAHIDAPPSAFYRAHLLRGLRAMYMAFARRHHQPAEILARAKQAKTMRAWDALVTAPRHGFSGPDDYYEKASAGPHLASIRVPALYVAAAGDPMVALADIEPALAAASPAVEVRVLPTGGHVAFPRTLDLGIAATLGLEAQVISWLLKGS